jgi:hypothetical protein
MKGRTIWIAGAAITIAISGGSAIASTSVDADDTPLTGPALRNATQSALEHTPGTVTDTELGDEGATYGVEVRREDGTEVEISLDENFSVVDEEVDDDGREEDDRDDRDNDDSGDGEDD